MNRRAFARKLAGAALTAGALVDGRRGNAEPEQVAPSKQGVAPFQISIMLWTVFGKLPFEQRLEKVAEAGYRNVELVSEFKSWSAEDYRRVNRKKHALGIRFDTTAGLTHGVGDPSQRAAFLAEVRGMLSTMDRLECHRLIAMSGNRVPGMPRSVQHQSCIEGLKRAADLIEGKNAQIVIENIDPEENPRYYLTSVAEGFKIVRAVNHPQVKFLYDFYHEQIAEGNLIEKLEKNIDFTGVVHIADVPGRHEPGTGEIDYRNIFKKLAQLKFDRIAAMEYFPTYDAVESLRTNRELALREGAA
ncbi:MAG TPA: TIM barrel protein [Terriglobia bacterium]|nr:TIM barrel protein [Terriglobia bacterium]